MVSTFLIKMVFLNLLGCWSLGSFLMKEDKPFISRGGLSWSENYSLRDAKGFVSCAGSLGRFLFMTKVDHGLIVVGHGRLTYFVFFGQAY